MERYVSFKGRSSELSYTSCIRRILHDPKDALHRVLLLNITFVVPFHERFAADCTYAKMGFSTSLSFGVLHI